MSADAPEGAHGPGGPQQSVTAAPVGPEAVILRFNEDDEANEELYESARLTTDVARRAGEEADRRRLAAKKARGAWRTAQLEHPDRRGWLPSMTTIALVLLGLDAGAAYFAAEALGGDQRITLLWAALFLVILGLLEAGLAWSAERSKRFFRLNAAGLAVFAVLLALLRFGFFAAVDTGVIIAVVGACVFTFCTIMFVAGGFAAIRYAETVTIWQARSRARKAAKTADAAEAEAHRRAAERDRRVGAYLGRIRPTLLRDLPGVNDLEAKVRAHMMGEPS
jgi:hypothetical protein